MGGWRQRGRFFKSEGAIFCYLNSTTNTYVANADCIKSAINNFEKCKKSYNSQSCKLSTLESVKDMLMLNFMY
jgi:hypothetical protein